VKWDVLVIGAGPAGASAAVFLARSGVRTLLADRQSFPRDKICGDGVSAAGLAVLGRLGLSSWVAAEGFFEPRTLLLSSPNGSSVTASCGEPQTVSYGRVIPRRKLDAALVAQAVAAGAQLAEGYHVRAVTRQDPDTVRVEGWCAGHAREETARLIVIAEGGQAALARALGLVRGPPDLVAVRGYFADAAPPDEMLEIHYEQAISPGYTWVFPLGGGRVNVGLGTFANQAKREGLNLVRLLGRSIEENPHLRRRLGHCRPESPIRGYPLRTGIGKARLYADNVLLAGEAGHLVNPLTGEGIAPAMESGELAARQAQRALQSGDLSADALAAYGRDLRRRYLADHRAAQFLRQMLGYRRVVDRLVGRASCDQDFAVTVGLAVIGMIPPRELLRPSNLVRFLV
jgi:menaquinone-9 beta-reductase